MATAAAVITVSDGCFDGVREDISGPVLANMLTSLGYSIVGRSLVPDKREAIESALIRYAAEDIPLVVTTGGTGFAPRDITPEATRAVIEREAPGLAELMRREGAKQTPRAALSRSVCGIRGRSLILNLPGSPRGVREGIESLAALLPHAIALIREEPVDHTPGFPEAESAVSLEQKPLSGDHAPSEIISLETNLDDLSPEFYELAIERLFQAGALDVYITSIQMKKGRPATLLTVLARPEDRSRLEELIFRETSTFGIRYTPYTRTVLDRRWEQVETVYGHIRIKVGTLRGEVLTASPEYEEVKTAARTHQAAVRDVYLAAQVAWDLQQDAARLVLNEDEPAV